MLESAKQICPKMQATRLIATERFELAYETVSAAGAVSVSKPVTLVVSGAGALALTLPQGYEGQVKTILMTTFGGGTATVTPTAGTYAHATHTTLTFTAAYQSWVGIFVLGKWHTLGTPTAVSA